MTIVWFSWKDIHNPLAGGAEVVAHQLLQRLAAAGHNVTLVTAGYAGAAATSTQDGYHIVRVGSRLTVYAAAYRWYRRTYPDQVPDLVIDECNTLPFFAQFYTRTRTILLAHMLCRRIWFYELPWLLGMVGYLAEPLYLRLLSGSNVITVSQSTKTDLMRHGFRAERIQIISEGSELAPICQLADARKFEQPTQLSLGSMRSMKQTLDQVKAFELAKRRVPSLKLIMAGDTSGKYGQKVLKYIATSAFATDIDVRGRVSTQEKLELMQRAHLITVTSVKEGWGLIVTEAASQGTPAVVYNVDGLRDSVRENETGLITSINTPQALADRVVELLGDPVRYERLRQTGWEWSKTITFDQSYSDFIKAAKIPLP